MIVETQIFLYPYLDGKTVNVTAHILLFLPNL
jgi:hypothetical protein